MINFSLEIPFFSVERAVFDVDPEIFIKGCDYMAETDRFKELYSSPDIMLRSARFLDDNLDGELVPDFVVRMYLRGKILQITIQQLYYSFKKRRKIFFYIRKKLL